LELLGMRLELLGCRVDRRRGCVDDRVSLLPVGVGDRALARTECVPHPNQWPHEYRPHAESEERHEQVEPVAGLLSFVRDVLHGVSSLRVVGFGAPTLPGGQSTVNRPPGTSYYLRL